MSCLRSGETGRDDAREPAAVAQVHALAARAARGAAGAALALLERLAPVADVVVGHDDALARRLHEDLGPHGGEAAHGLREQPEAHVLELREVLEIRLHVRALDAAVLVEAVVQHDDLARKQTRTAIG